MDYDSWKSGYYENDGYRECDACKNTKKEINEVEGMISELKQSFGMLSDILYGRMEFSEGKIEDILDNICYDLDLPLRNGELKIGKKRKPVPAYVQNILNYQKELLDQG